MCNYAGSFVLVTWVVSRCAVKLIIDVGAHRLRAWQGLLESTTKKNSQMKLCQVCVCTLHTFMWEWIFLYATESTCNRSDLKNPVPVCLSYVLISQSVIAPPRSSSRLSFSAASVSTGLLARCVCHVQSERLCGKEAPSWGILNFSHPNKGWCCQKVLWLFSFCVTQAFIGYCYEEATKQWPHHSLSGYTARGKV